MSNESIKLKYIILDTSALLAKYQLLYYSNDVVLMTTPLVVSEVKDHESRSALDLAVSLGKLLIVEPQEALISKARDFVQSIGENYSISPTDLSVIALALQLKDRLKRGEVVVVITDDYSIQNTLLNAGVAFKPLRTRGIRIPRKYFVICPTCNYASTNILEKTCPLCNTPLIKLSS
ncbi:MAG: hypothetical protein N3E36_01720 [Sulfolobales archaeon]|nr:hypothetical protein [Sulfolobales archaeon]